MTLITRVRMVAAAGLGVLAAGCVQTASSTRITVAAADVDRAMQVAELKLPEKARAATAVRGIDGTLLPLQVDVDGTARFIVPSQKAGEALTFTLADGSAPATSGVQ